MTKTKTLEKFRSLNQLLADTFDEVGALDPEVIFREKGDEWSVIQVLEHLYNVEDRSLKYLEYKLDQGTKFEKVGIKQKYNTWVMRRAYKSRRKFVAPENVRPKNNYTDLESLRTDYLALRKKIYTFLQERAEEEYKLAMYKAPYFGRLSLYQMLIFIEGHYMRHMRQMKRIMESLGATV